MAAAVESRIRVVAVVPAKASPPPAEGTEDREISHVDLPSLKPDRLQPGVEFGLDPLERKSSPVC
jgi:hypothetical protein